MDPSIRSDPSGHVLVNCQSSSCIEDMDDEDDSDTSSPPLPYLQGPPPDGCCTINGMNDVDKYMRFLKLKLCTRVVIFSRTNTEIALLNTFGFLQLISMCRWNALNHHAFAACFWLSSSVSRILSSRKGPSLGFHGNRVYRGSLRVRAGRCQIAQHPGAHPGLCSGQALPARREWEKCTFRWCSSLFQSSKKLHGECCLFRLGAWSSFFLFMTAHYNH